MPHLLVLAPFLLPLAPQSVLRQLPGTGLPQESGHAVCTAGDVDGDGLTDLWVGAPDTSGSEGGHAFLFPGAGGAAVRTLAGADAFERFGHALAAGRDLSGDGVPDVVVGAPLAGGPDGPGAVRAFSGADGAPLWAIPGETALERFGAALALLDDVNGDGVAELVAGAPGDDTAGTDAGCVRLFSGASGAPLARFHGTAAFEELGAALARAGDLDGDGREELLAGAPGAATGAGYALVLSGASGALVRVLSGPASGARFGHALAAAGDIDADGVPDVIVGAPGSGSAHVFSGADGAELFAVTRTRSEPQSISFLDGPARFGWAVAGAGDADGDGHGDFAVGYPEHSAVWLFSGADARVLGVHASSHVYPSSGEILSAFFGFALARVPDLDGDGRDELAVGAPLDSVTGEWPIGSVALLATRPDPAWIAPGEDVRIAAVARAGDVDGDGRDDLAWATADEIVIASGLDHAPLRSLGAGGVAALAPAGDVDADGVEDLIAGFPYEDAARGAARVYSGASGALLLTLEPVESPRPRRIRPRRVPRHDRFGTAVAAAGDVDGDGHDDVLVGAPRAPHPSACVEVYAEAGYAAVLSGRDGSLLLLVEGDGLRFDDRPWSEAFGFAVAGCGDWDRDGVPDVAVGAPGGGPLASGLVRVFGGASGAVLDTFTGNAEEFGIALDGAHDFDADGDGFVDLVVGGQTVGYGPFSETSGGVWVFSSRTHATLHVESGTPPPTGYGRSVGPGYAVAALSDFDGDGRSDFALGNPAAQGLLGRGVGEITVHSGVTGAVIERFTGTSSWDYLGYSVRSAGDTDGDGRSDLLMLAPVGEQPGSLPRLRVLAGG
jgi:hypothetical protein